MYSVEFCFFNTCHLQIALFLCSKQGWLDTRFFLANKEWKIALASTEVLKPWVLWLCYSWLSVLLSGPLNYFWRDGRRIAWYPYAQVSRAHVCPLLFHKGETHLEPLLARFLCHSFQPFPGNWALTYLFHGVYFSTDFPGSLWPSSTLTATPEGVPLIWS